VLLIGDLGAGKTTLAKGIIEGLHLAAPDEVTSPTYTLIHEYGVPPRLYHIDLYRLDTEEEVRGIGIQELLDRDALLLIEWGERFPDLWPKRRIEIHCRYESGEEDRKFDVAYLE
jgi:tRNA threonylcarbamoyladenosine biosynthesis protein TsaE